MDHRLEGITKARSLKIFVTHGDALEFDADVLLLKYAQKPHGADRAAARRLAEVGIEPTLPKPGGFTLESTRGKMKPKSILFAGVKPIQHFLYSEIREFTKDSLTFVSRTAPNIKSVALTIHGPGYGLDEIESFRSEVAGITDAISNNTLPSGLQTIAFVENVKRRAERLALELKSLFPNGIIRTDPQGFVTGVEKQADESLRTAGVGSSSKLRVFVAMPFATEMDDVFHYAIQGGRQLCWISL